MDDASTTALVARLASGRKDSFATLYARIAQPLHLWCAVRIPRALWHRLHPDDLLQETWYRALQALPRFDRKRASFRAWVFGIAANTLAHELRRLHVRLREQQAPGDASEGRTGRLDRLPADLTSVVQQVARNDAIQKLLDTVEGLSTEERELLLGRACEELSHAELGARLGVNADACEARWRRLRERLRNHPSLAGLLD